MELYLSVLMGIGLSAASGFKLFVPLLIISLASLSGHLELSSGFEWIGTYPAFIIFLTATVLEIAAYFIPGIDNLLDTLEGPAAFVAGTIITAAFIGEMSPYLRITLSIIAGGGTASAVQFSTATARGGSTLTTGGAANPFLNIFEIVFSVLISIFSLLYPILVIVLLIFMAYIFIKKFYPKIKQWRL
ncbi:DUF4126 domain-containing protein [Halanaerobium hydrogeniformans]|uniref:DUF4126 domain-containing protein n=1 Tax=Halanaerobium hydrogeniformans TaxID=656519 RepID=E4RNE8_HALHG|nr:DUF4126 domain-containing protein [Halanaerobium hydrogeniformans]ADQ13616.1 hypothetical protein Halsa_0126 [Halanaerobium hydrogeniformans]